jgi:hypothetical protein
MFFNLTEPFRLPRASITRVSCNRLVLGWNFDIGGPSLGNTQPNNDFRIVPISLPVLTPI